MRGKLGESRSSIQKLNLPLEQVTSGSLEALKSYSTGIQILTQGRFLDARPFFEHAVALDPKFAMAYSYLATACGNAGDTQCQRDYERKAFALIDRVSERERPYIAGGYYDATGELEKELAVTRVGVATYPRVWSFHNSISEVDIILGQFEDGVREAETASQLQPDGDPPYRRVLDADMDLDRLDAANKTVNTLRSRNLGGARLHQRFLELAYAQDDETAAAKEIQWFAGKPEEYLSFGLQAAYLNVKGERRESAKLYQQAAQSALSQNLKELSAQIEEANALAGALWGDCDQALRLRRPALALAMCGNEAGARKLIAETSGQFPNGLIWNKVELPAIRAAIESHNGRPERAIELLASAAPYEGAYPQVAYLRGVALLHLKKGSDAAVEFRKITEHKGRSWGTTWYLPDWGLYYPVASLSLARALASTGDAAKTRRAYEDFFTLWRDADREHPVLIEARKEYAKLR